MSRAQKCPRCGGGEMNMEDLMDYHGINMCWPPEAKCEKCHHTYESHRTVDGGQSFSCITILEQTRDGEGMFEYLLCECNEFMGEEVLICISGGCQREAKFLVTGVGAICENCMGNASDLTEWQRETAQDVTYVHVPQEYPCHGGQVGHR